MAGGLNGARAAFGGVRTRAEDEARPGPLAEVEVVPGGMGWLIERSAGCGRIWTEWPLAPGSVVRLRSGDRTVDEDDTAQILRSELIELRQGRPPLYESVLLFSQPRV